MNYSKTQANGELAVLWFLRSSSRESLSEDSKIKKDDIKLDDIKLRKIGEFEPAEKRKKVKIWGL